jgi:hypothetical protein
LASSGDSDSRESRGRPESFANAECFAGQSGQGEGLRSACPLTASPPFFEPEVFIMSKTTEMQLLAPLLLLLSLGGAALADDNRTACERSASDMLQACRSGVRDDLYTTIANCRNVADRSQRSACFEEARGTKKEEQGLCRDIRDARVDACELLGEDRYRDPLLDPDASFIHPDDVPGVYPPNPFVSVAAGHTYVLRAGEEGEETVVVHVTDESREILGVDCRVVLDVVLESETDGAEVEYEAVEVTDDWFAQDEVGNVYYCGEVSRNFEDGVLRNLEGSFEAGLDFANAGVLIRAFPAVGDAHRQEYSLGEAEDIIRYVAEMTAPGEDEGGDNAAFPCSPDACLKTLEFAPLEPESSEFKYYLPGTGFVLAVAMEEGEFTGEREELVCVGDSLDILSSPACEIGDPEALRETLCAQSAAFCE